VSLSSHPINSLSRLSISSDRWWRVDCVARIRIRMRMKRESPAACIWLLMLVLVAMAPGDAAYINSADTEAIGDNNQVLHLFPLQFTCILLIKTVHNLTPKFSYEAEILF